MRFDKRPGFRQIWRVEKKVGRILRRVRNEPGLSTDEKYLFARSLAASPDERWRMHENFLRSHDLFTRSSREKYGFKYLVSLPLLEQTIQ